MKKPIPLNYIYLRNTLRATDLRFKNTNELKLLDEFVGQERAQCALTFGIGIANQGYNIYAMGSAGIGKRSLVNLILTKNSKKRPTPSDWCYIYNFDNPEKPLALALPPGLGIIFQQDMKLFITELSKTIISVFESEEYQSAMKKIHDIYNAKRKKIIIIKKYNTYHS